MGGCVSVDPETRIQNQRNKEIEGKLRTDKKEYENTIKILLLGRCY